MIPAMFNRSKQVARTTIEKISPLLLQGGIEDFENKNLPLLQKIILTRPLQRTIICVVAILATVSAILAPYFQMKFINGLSHQNISLDSGIQLIFIAFGFMLLGQVLNLASRLLCARESFIAQRWLSSRLYEHTLFLKTEERHKKTVGETVALYASDVQTACAILEDTLPNVLASVFPIIIAPIAISIIYNISVLPIIIAIGCTFVVCAILSFRQSVFLYTYKKLTEERLAIVNEWLQNLRAIRILGWIDLFEARIFEKRDEETNNRLGMVTNGSVMNSVVQVAPLILNVIAISTLVFHESGKLSPGDIFGVLWILAVFLARPIRLLSWTLVTSLDSLTSAKRLEGFLQLKAEKSLPKTKQKEVAPSLFVKNLSLNMSGRTLLKNISMDIAEGSFVALVGEVGAGKSLIINSLIGDLPCTFDTYRIGEEDVLSWDLEDLRSQFALVPQEGFVMSSSLRDNVHFSYDTSSLIDKDAYRALELAQFDVSSERMEAGLSTEIGERGVNMSGGQRQRLNIARAFVSKRQIILLDDSFSALDVNTQEKMTRKLLKGDWKNCTRFLVTHRLSLLTEVDKIYFLDRGQIIAEGTFAELQLDPKFFEFTRTLKGDE